MRGMSLLTAAFASILLHVTTVAATDEASIDDESLTSIPIDSLPAPSDEIRELLQDGGVTFCYGPRSGLDDAGPDSVSNRRRKLAGETKLQLEYDYRSRTRWRIIESKDERRLSIHVRYSDIRLHDSHRVWFRKKPSIEDFWRIDLCGMNWIMCVFRSTRLFANDLNGLFATED